MIKSQFATCKTANNFQVALYPFVKKNDNISFEGLSGIKQASKETTEPTLTLRK